MSNKKQNKVPTESLVKALLDRRAAQNTQALEETPEEGVLYYTPQVEPDTEQTDEQESSAGVTEHRPDELVDAIPGCPDYCDTPGPITYVPNESVDDVPGHPDYCDTPGPEELEFYCSPEEETNAAAEQTVETESLYVSSIVSLTPNPDGQTSRLIFENVYGEYRTLDVASVGNVRIVKDFDVSKVETFSLFEAILDWLEIDMETYELKPMSRDDWGMKLAYVILPSVERLIEKSYPKGVASHFFYDSHRSSGGALHGIDIMSREEILKRVMRKVEVNGGVMADVQHIVHLLDKQVKDVLCLDLVFPQ